MHRDGLFELRRTGLAQAEMAYLTGGDQLGHRADGVGHGHLRVDPVQVVEVDHVDTEPLERVVAVSAYVLGTSVQTYAVRTAHDAEFRRQHHVVAAAGDGTSDQSLVVPAAVAHGCVDQGDA